jgi:signal transduction histidine kinase
VLGGAGQVELDCPDDLRAWGDVQAFDRIVSNLLANAALHGAPPFSVEVEVVEDDLAITVEDRGEGIAPKFVGNLFERFTRGPTSASEGAGLGLSIAQSYTRAHGGSLVYEPAEPHGSRFRLLLPAAVRRSPARVRG